MLVLVALPLSVLAEKNSQPSVHILSDKNRQYLLTCDSKLQNICAVKEYKEWPKIKLSFMA
jgi:hypothetical protein